MSGMGGWGGSERRWGEEGSRYLSSSAVRAEGGIHIFSPTFDVCDVVVWGDGCMYVPNSIKLHQTIHTPNFPPPIPNPPSLPFFLPPSPLRSSKPKLVREPIHIPPLSINLYPHTLPHPLLHIFPLDIEAWKAAVHGAEGVAAEDAPHAC